MSVIWTNLLDFGVGLVTADRVELFTALNLSGQIRSRFLYTKFFCTSERLVIGALDESETMPMRKRWQDQGDDPDYRFSLANERTFLAWIRTALAILAGAVLLHQFAQYVQPRWAVAAICSGLSVAGAFLGGAAYTRWRGNEIAMRHHNALPRTRLLLILSAVTCLLAGAVALLLHLP